MPIKPSAKKALRVSRRKTARNIEVKKNLEGVLKKANPKNLIEIQSLLDRAAKKGIIHKKKAARLKSRLFKKFGAPSGGSAKKVEVKAKVKLRARKKSK